MRASRCGIAALVLVALGVVSVHAQTVTLLHDVAPGATSSTPQFFVPFGDDVYFIADDRSGGHGRELWRSDGSDAGTVLEADIVVGSESSAEWLHGVVAGRLLFTAKNASLVRTLFSTSGGGAVPEPLLRTHGGGVLPVMLGDRLIVPGVDTATGGELWATDGTVSGTVRLTDAWPGAGDAAPEVLTVADDHVYFSAVTSVGGAFLGRELWRTDGTPAGTALVRDFVPGSGSSNPANLRWLDGLLYFQIGCEAWRTDGTTAGTILLASRCIAALDKLAAGVVLFGQTPDGVPATDLMWIWRSDGTPSGTVPIAPLESVAPGTPPQPTDGTFRAVVGDRLVLNGRDATHGVELWVTDGTVGGTGLLVDLQPGTGHSRPKLIGSTGAVAFFVAQTTAAGFELWRTDGTAPGTFRLTDRAVDAKIAGFSPGSLTPLGRAGSDYLLAGDALFFQMDDGVAANELWMSDGTVTGTVRITDLNPGAGGSFPSEMGAAIASGRLFVGAFAPGVGIEPWVIDGILPPLSAARLRVSKLDTPPGDEVVAIDGEVRVHPEPAVDPLVNGMRVRVGRMGEPGALDVAIPGGAFDKSTRRGWTRARNGRSWRYRGDGASTGGVRKVVVTGNPTTGELRVKLSAMNARLALDPSGPVPLTVLVDGPSGAHRQGGEVVLAPSSCSFSGRKLTCR